MKSKGKKDVLLGQALHPTTPMLSLVVPRTVARHLGPSNEHPRAGRHHGIQYTGNSFLAPNKRRK